jgi:hypothetical protein
MLQRFKIIARPITLDSFLSIVFPPLTIFLIVLIVFKVARYIFISNFFVDFSMTKSSEYKFAAHNLKFSQGEL